MIRLTIERRRRGWSQSELARQRSVLGLALDLQVLVVLVPFGVTFLAGVAAGWLLLAMLPVARRAFARQAAQVQREAQALAAWQAVVSAYRPSVARARQGAN